MKILSGLKFGKWVIYVKTSRITELVHRRYRSGGSEIQTQGMFIINTGIKLIILWSYNFNILRLCIKSLKFHLYN